MFRSAILFFICSLLLAAAGCKTYESTLGEQHETLCDIDSFAPSLGKALYKAEVEITGHHLSGLLLFKTMEDSTQRIAFLLETGQSIFDFGFDQTERLRYITFRRNSITNLSLRPYGKILNCCCYSNMNFSDRNIPISSKETVILLTVAEMKRSGSSPIKAVPS